MVLDDSSSPTADASYDAFPTNDNFNEDSQLEPSQMDINLKNFPRPLPVLGALCGWGNKRLINDTQANLKIAMTAMQRRLTRDEVTAFTYLTAKEVRTMSYAVPMGVAVSLWRAYDTRNTWKFPFYKASADFNPQELRVPVLGVVLRDEFARSFWRISRVMAYGTVGLCLTYMIALPYAASVWVVEALTDPRLKAYREFMENRQKQAEAQQGQQTAKAKQQVQQKDPYGQGTINAGELWKNGQRAIGRSNTYGDDASPTDGQLQESSPNSGYDQSGSQSSPAIDQYQSPAVPSTDRGTASSQHFDSYDDASPTAPYPSSSDSSNSGSAWDRIRNTTQDPMSSPPRSERARGRPSSTKMPRENSNETDGSSSLSSADQDRQLARSGAQKDFNDKLERERHGQDFGSSKGSSADDGLW